MKLFFDTETTGKAEMRLPHDHPSQPHIVQFAALLTDDQGQEASVFSVIIKPDGWTIPDEAAAIHGITTQHAEQCGVPIACALSMFSMLALTADTLIAHNIDFDDFVTRGEYARLGKEPRHAKLTKFCTMKASTQLCQIPNQYWKPGRDRYKWPKLEEAMRIILRKELQGAHDAFADMKGCAELYFHLAAQSALPSV